MKILAPVKRVIDPYVPPRIDGDGVNVVSEGVAHTLNPFDEVALAKAASLRADGLALELVAVSIGPDREAETLRTALAIGADRAIHLLTPADAHHSSDAHLSPFAVAHMLKAVIDEEKPDLLLMGKQAVDDDAAQVPALLAGLANLPFLPDIFTLKIDAAGATAEYELNGAVIRARASLPLIASCELHLAQPRPLSLKQTMQARRKPMETRQLTADDLAGDNLQGGSAAVRQSLHKPESRPPCRFFDTPEELAAQLRQDGVWPS